jgi:hypothetical protein
VRRHDSTDKSRHTWKFISHIASGGRAIPNNGETPVWEPFLMMWQGKMVVYYSDQRDPTAGQKLVHQVSSDLVHWEDPVDDVKHSTFSFRPGMTTVSELPFNQFMLTYEFFGAVEAPFAIYYRISQDPLNFNASGDNVVRATDGTVPTSSPYNVWTPVGGPLGTIVVSCGTDSAVYLNHQLGAPGAWTRVNLADPRTSYARSLRVLPNQEDILLVGGGVLSGTNNSVTANVISVAPNTPVFARCNQ